MGKGVYPRETNRSPSKNTASMPKRETGPERWARWAVMAAGGMTKAEVARQEGVSRAAVTMGLRKLARADDADQDSEHSSKRAIESKDQNEMERDQRSQAAVLGQSCRAVGQNSCGSTR